MDVLVVLRPGEHVGALGPNDGELLPERLAAEEGPTVKLQSCPQRISRKLVSFCWEPEGKSTGGDVQAERRVRTEPVVKSRSELALRTMQEYRLEVRKLPLRESLFPDQARRQPSAEVAGKPGVKEALVGGARAEKGKDRTVAEAPRISPKWRLPSLSWFEKSTSHVDYHPLDRAATGHGCLSPACSSHCQNPWMFSPPYPETAL